MIGITTQIEVRLSELGVKIEKKDIEIRIEKLINEFKVPPEEAKQTVINYFLIRHKRPNTNFVLKQNAQKVKVSNIKQDGKWVTLRCKVVKLLDTHHESIDQDGFLGDESGTIKFTKWAKSNLLQLIEGDNYLFENVIT